MKKFLVFLLISVTALSSCVTDIEIESSIPVKEDNESISSIGDTSVVSSDISTHSFNESESADSSFFTDSSQESNEESTITVSGVTEETILFGSFTVETEHAVYDFIAEEGTGDYRTTFTTTETNPNSITITLADGRTMQLNHTGIVYDEEAEIYRTEINGLDFLVYEYLNSNNTLCQVYDCIDPMDNLGDFNGRVISTITVNFNPELESGDIRMVFLYEIKGDEVTIRYADGKELTKTVKYDEKTEQYYFGE